MERNVKYIKSNLCIDINCGYIYQIDMERCTDAAQLLDFILQINNKTWGTADVMKSILDCIEEACRHVHKTNAQGVFCPGGSFRKVEWPRRGSYNRSI